LRRASRCQVASGGRRQQAEQIAWIGSLARSSKASTPIESTSRIRFAVPTYCTIDALHLEEDFWKRREHRVGKIYMKPAKCSKLMLQSGNMFTMALQY
jgi:hypothetical protein